MSFAGTIFHSTKEASPNPLATFSGSEFASGTIKTCSLSGALTRIMKPFTAGSSMYSEMSNDTMPR